MAYVSEYWVHALGVACIIYALWVVWMLLRTTKLFQPKYRYATPEEKAFSVKFVKYTQALSAQVGIGNMSQREASELAIDALRVWNTPDLDVNGCVVKKPSRGEVLAVDISQLVVMGYTTTELVPALGITTALENYITRGRWLPSIAESSGGVWNFSIAPEHAEMVAKLFAPLAKVIEPMECSVAIRGIVGDGDEKYMFSELNLKHVEVHDDSFTIESSIAVTSTAVKEFLRRVNEARTSKA